MPESSLIVPVVVPTGSLHFATIGPDGIVQDVIDVLLAQPEVTSEVLGGLDGVGWGLQKIRIEKSGRQWEEEDLEKLGDGQSRLLCLFGRTADLLPSDVPQAYWIPSCPYPPCSTPLRLPKIPQPGTSLLFLSHPTCTRQPCDSYLSTLRSP